ncbi:MAG TPA: hypothetical protein VHH34_03820 [Pseudonocardiaceae bacterium]|nr:hypothetical protein [Pseudonocardiaceae bacterium]
MGEQDFVDRITEGFASLRDRPHFNFLASQFAAGEISFIVDHRGIRIVVEDGSPDGDPDLLG